MDKIDPLYLCPACGRAHLNTGNLCWNCKVYYGDPIPCRCCGQGHILGESSANQPSRFCSVDCERDWDLDLTDAEMAAVHLVREFDLTTEEVRGQRKWWFWQKQPQRPTPIGN